jgi:DNA-binding winged helix-turn-helix (wHTH) protein
LPRAARAGAGERWRFGGFELDEVKACLLRDGKVLSLPPTPFAVLCALVRQPGVLLTKNALLDEVWGHQCVSDSVLKTVISELRTLLDDDAREPRFIETVSRRGYRFVAAVNSAPAGSLGAARIAASGSRQVPSFIGREQELSRLQRAWDEACAGGCKVVWVAGEPGIGKTSLIEQFVGSLGDVVCVRGQCVEHDGSGEPYLPVLEALAQLCRVDTGVPALLRAVAPTTLLQLPWLSSAEERDALRGDLPRVGMDRMLREMGEVLDRYTEGRPLLLVTEDLHWADRSTVQLIDYIARRGSARLMWLASFRPAAVIAANHPLNAVRHELRLHGMCEELALDSFSEAEVAQYAAERLPSLAADEAFVRSLYERTDGVPLFVASLMREVVARAARRADGLPQLADVAVPTNLAAMIDHHIAKLELEQRALLSAAAVCGIEFRVSTLSRALDRDDAWVGQACEALAREQLWLRGPRDYSGGQASEHPYSFRHPLFRQVLYERTPAVARAQLHGKVRAALETERDAGGQLTAELALPSCRTAHAVRIEPSEKLARLGRTAQRDVQTTASAPGRTLEPCPFGSAWPCVNRPRRAEDAAS